jgi:inorganic pyrophosphatase
MTGASCSDDGDPLDIMVIHDATTFPGIVLTCCIIGILQIEQKSKARPSGTTACSPCPGRSH